MRDQRGQDAALATTGFPPFGANGLALRGGALYVANTGNDTVLRLPSTRVEGNVCGHLGPKHQWGGWHRLRCSGRLWVCANQGDELVVLEEINTNGMPVGSVLFKVGDFEGIVGQPGARRPKGFLFPASLVIVGHKVYITNLSFRSRRRGR